MIGNNTITINQATMNEAIQFWLINSQLKDAKFKVTLVRESKESFGSAKFNIELSHDIGENEDRFDRLEHRDQMIQDQGL